MEDLMGGIMNAGAPGGKDPRESLLPEETAEGEVTDTESGDAASSEEQAQYDMAIDRALKVIYDDKMLPTITQKLKGSSPVESVGPLVAMVMTRVDDAAADAGDALTDDVLFHGSRELVEDLLDLHAMVNGATPDDEQIEGTFNRAMLELARARAANGKADPAQAEEELKEMASADRRGGLGQMLPGIEGASEAPLAGAMMGGVK